MTVNKFSKRLQDVGLASLLLAVFVALSGCALSPTQISEMSAALSEELAMAQQEMAAPVNLEAGFMPALAEAVNTNPGYRAALAAEREAASNVGVAESVRWPQLGIDANLGGIREFDSAGETITGLAGGLTLSQLVFDGGESTAAINRATAEVLAAEADRLNLANTLAFDVARAWLDVAQFSERLALLRDRSSELDTLVTQIERMAANGMIDRSAVDSVRRQIVDIQLEEARLLSSLADAQVRFRRYYRQSADGISRPEPFLASEDARSHVEQWPFAPSLALQAANVIAARHTIAEAEAAFRPRLRFQTGINSPLNNDNPATGNFGLRFDYNVFDGSRRARQLESAIARAAALEGRLREEQLNLEAELEAAMARLKSIDRSLELVDLKRTLSQSEARTVRSQLMTGQASLRQLVEAEIESYRAEDQAIALHVERQQLLFSIAARTGALQRIIGLDASQ